MQVFNKIYAQYINICTILNVDGLIGFTQFMSS